MRLLSPVLLVHSMQCRHAVLFSIIASVDDQPQAVVSTSMVSFHLTIFAFSAEEIQIVATEYLLMNAQIRRIEPDPGVFKRVHSSTIKTSMINLQLFIGPLPKLHFCLLASTPTLSLSPEPQSRCHCGPARPARRPAAARRGPGTRTGITVSSFAVPVAGSMVATVQM
jgi:hypothetical protein